LLFINKENQRFILQKRVGILHVILLRDGLSSREIKPFYWLKIDT